MRASVRAVEDMLRDEDNEVTLLLILNFDLLAFLMRIRIQGLQIEYLVPTGTGT